MDNFGSNTPQQDNDKQKRIKRRDKERERRQNMASLYESLRIQIPVEYMEEKSTVPDLIHEAVNYVKHKEKSIEELKAKRDNLKNLNSANQSSSCSYDLPIDVSVRSCLGGVEILLSVDTRRDTFSLSRVMEVVIAKGLSVVSCFSSKANGKTLHTIQVEVSHPGEVDAYKLQQELTDIVNSP